MSEAIGLHELERIWETVSYCYGLKEFIESRQADCANEGVDILNLRSAILSISDPRGALFQLVFVLEVSILVVSTPSLSYHAGSPAE
jgi:hypothetical protein